jgi:glycosyltransferase involved in cell wall biosynthesis
MKGVTIVTGSLPPDICGCGEYAKLLGDAFQRIGVTASLYYRKDWQLRKLVRYARELNGSDTDIVNIQYPTQGYGWSVVPQLLPWLIRRRKVIVTLHEFSRKRWEARLTIYLCFLFADWIIFTTEPERRVACRVAPWIAKRSSVVSIGSNIPLCDPLPSETDVAYFGLIHPAKGIETFAATVSALAEHSALRVRAVGQIPRGYEGYAEQILGRLKDCGVEIELDRSAEEVASILCRTRIALLPFPDGMSRRRGTALAAMGNGALLITLASRDDSDFFRKICAMAANASNLTEVVADALNHPDRYESVRAAGQEFARSVSWSAVAEGYLEVFERLQAGVSPFWNAR